MCFIFFFFFSSRRRHTRSLCDWSSDVCSSDLTGLTLTYLLRVLAARGPAGLRVCALLDKRARRIVDVPLSYVGFEVPDVFLVGYGLDLDERERGRSELLAVDNLEAVRADPALLDQAARPDTAWRPPRA